MKLKAGMERQLLPFSPVSLVWVPSTRRHSQYPCPKSDIVALLHNICNDELYPEAEVDQGNLRNAPFSCQSGCKIRSGPHRTPQNAKFPANVNDLD